MKEQHAFRTFKEQLDEKYRLYEAESNQNKDVYCENLAQHIIYSYQDGLHKGFSNDETLNLGVNDDKFNEESLNIDILQFDPFHKKNDVNLNF